MTMAKRALVLVAACLGLGGVAAADGPVPYKIWWSFPNDDDTAIEVDEPDLDMSRWEGQRWKFAVEMQHCDVKKSKVLAQHKDGTPVREMRVDALEPDGKVRATQRCVMTLADWRKRLGRNMIYRLDDELDAHAAFLLPRRGPGMPAKAKLDDGGDAAPAPAPTEGKK